MQAETVAGPIRLKCNRLPSVNTAYPLCSAACEVAA
ncbi:hypothetical protein P3T18_003574 [Paraburkholderia sp. GAS199]